MSGQSTESPINVSGASGPFDVRLSTNTGHTVNMGLIFDEAKEAMWAATLIRSALGLEMIVYKPPKEKEESKKLK